MIQELKEKIGAVKLMDHDLVNSLYVIKGLAEAQLEVEEAEEADKEELLNRAQSALTQTMKQANKVIEMIHYFRSMAFGVQDRNEDPTTTSVQESVTEVLHAMSYEFPFRNITVLKILPHNLPPLTVSREHLDTILFQLIYNARRAIGERGGIITIEAGEKLVPSAGDTGQKHYVIRVADTGDGINQGALPHIFDPFFSNSDSGSGLGLYIARKLIELNGGSVKVDSSEKGTSFYLDFAA